MSPRPIGVSRRCLMLLPQNVSVGDCATSSILTAALRSRRPIPPGPGHGYMTSAASTTLPALSLSTEKSRHANRIRSSIDAGNGVRFSWSGSGEVGDDRPVNGGAPPLGEHADWHECVG